MSKYLERLHYLDEAFQDFCKGLTTFEEEDKNLFLKGLSYIEKELKKVEKNISEISSKEEKEPVLKEIQEWMKERFSFYQKMNQVKEHFAFVSPNEESKVASFLKLVSLYEEYKREFEKNITNDLQDFSFLKERIDTLTKVKDRLNLMYQEVFKVSDELEKTDTFPHPKSDLESNEEYEKYVNEFYGKETRKKEIEEPKEEKQESEMMKCWLDHYKEFKARNSYLQKLDLSHPVFQKMAEILNHPTTNAIELLKVSALEIMVESTSLENKKSLLSTLSKERNELIKEYLNQEQDKTSFAQKSQGMKELTQLMLISQMFQCCDALEQKETENRQFFLDALEKYQEGLGLIKKEEQKENFSFQANLPKAESHYQNGVKVEETKNKELSYIPVSSSERDSLKKVNQRKVLDTLVSRVSSPTLEEAHIPYIGEIVRMTYDDFYAPMDASIFEIRFVSPITGKMVSSKTNEESMKYLRMGYLVHSYGCTGPDQKPYYCSYEQIKEESRRV